MLVRDETRLKFSNNENGVDSFVKFKPCIDKLRPFLGPSLENRIHTVLQEFICKSNSRYARRFPRVKRLLDVVAAWADCFDVSGKDTDVRQEMINHVIEYLMKDGLVTQFAEPFVLNSQSNKMDLDSLAIERNALKSMNVWRFINEKDYWLCQDCAVPASIEEENDQNVHQCNKECCNSDLDVEVGSILKEHPGCTSCCSENNEDIRFHTNCGFRDVEFIFTPRQNVSLNPQRGKIENAKHYQAQINQPDVNFIFNPNQDTLNYSQTACNTSNTFKYLPVEDNLKQSDTECTCNKSIANKKSLQTQTSRNCLNFMFKEVQCSCNILKETFNTSNNTKRVPTKEFRFKEVQCSPNLYNETSNTLNNLKHLPTKEFRFKEVQCSPNLYKETSNTLNNLKHLPTKEFRFKEVQCSPNLLKEAFNTSNNVKHRPTKEFRFKEVQCSPNLLKEASNTSNNVKHRPTKEFRFKEVQCSLNLLKEASNTSNNVKHRPTEEIREKSKCECNEKVFSKKSKLKMYVHKMTSTIGSKIRNPPKVSNLSLPCKSNHLIVQLFEADPSLSDSCLILMKKKFEKNIHNACSCLNDILKKLDASAIKKLRLNCEIRPGRVDLNLKRKDEGTSNVGWFLARVPTCSNIHKRDPCDENVRSCENSKDLPADPRCCVNVTKREEEFEEREVAFYAICSNQSLTDKRRTSVTENKIERGKEVNFVWRRKDEKQMDFALSSGLLKLQDNVDSVASSGKKTIIDETRGKMADEIRDEKKKEGRNCKKEEIEYFDGRCERCENLERIELKNCDLEHDFIYDNKEEDVSRDGNSTCGGCNPGQCLCHIFCTNNALNEKTEEFKRVDYCSCNLEEEIFKVQQCTNMKENIFETELRKEIAKEENFGQQNILQVGNTRKSETKIVHQVEKTESSLEVKEVYSVDSIRDSNVNSTEVNSDARCSCCGEDLSNSLSNKETNIKVTKSIEHVRSKETVSVLKTHKTSNLIVSENTENIISVDAKHSSTLQSLKSKIIFSENRNQNSTEQNYAHENVNKILETSKVCREKTPSVPESLFVFCRTNSNYSSSSSNTFTDEENSSEEKRQTNTKRECVCRKPILKSICQKSFSNFTKYNLKRKIKEADVPLISRYKNRLRQGGSNNICSSFPAIDRIKYLIRKKLRKLLLEERDKGTSTSKTFLGNDRYLVSISSGKLNDNRIIRDSCSAGSSIRCPFTTRNRCVARGFPERTFTEGSSLRKNKDAFLDNIKEQRYEKTRRNNNVFNPEKSYGEGSFLRKKKGTFKTNIHEGRCQRVCRDYNAFVPEKTSTDRSFLRKKKGRFKCQRINQGNDTFKRTETGKKCDSKSTDTQDLINERKDAFLSSNLKDTGKKRSVNYSLNDGVHERRSNSMRIILLEDDNCHFLTKKVFQKRERNFKEKTVTRNFYLDFNGTKNRLKKNHREPGVSGCSFEQKRNGGGKDTVGRIHRDRLISFEKRFLEEDNNFSTFLTDYEKRINDLDTNFRLKLLQYVALCRSVKNSLIESLQLDDVYEISSSSV
ncbi:hypothetical protein ANTRET_LOCUS3564 [Anthophora retusa]